MKLGIIGNTTKSVIKEIIPELLTWLERKNIDCILDKELADYLTIKNKKIVISKIKDMGHACDIVLAFGGDGTILSTAREVGRFGVPILGVNLGGLGFLAEVALEQLYPTLISVFEHRYTILERMALKAEIIGRRRRISFLGLNDIVIDKGSFSRVMRVKMFINDEYLTTYQSDGVIIATPTGSTAYSLSALGPILTPNVNAIVINPICPHSLGARPMVIPDDSEIKIIPFLDEKRAILSADGQIEDRLKNNEEIVVKKADFTVRWIQYEGNSFYNVLRTKLNWGGR